MAFMKLWFYMRAKKNSHVESFHQFSVACCIWWQIFSMIILLTVVRELRQSWWFQVTHGSKGNVNGKVYIIICMNKNLFFGNYTVQINTYILIICFFYYTFLILKMNDDWIICQLFMSANYIKFLFWKI